MIEAKFVAFASIAWFALTVCMLAVFLHYLWYNRSNGYRGLQAAIAVTIFLIGEVVIRGVSGVWWHHRMRGMDTSGIVDGPAFSFGMVVAAFGALCMIRIFTPREWGNWPWLTSALIALLAGAAAIQN